MDYVREIPNIYYRHRDGHLSKLNRERLWIKGPGDQFLCLDERYNYQRVIRSPSPDLDDSKQNHSQNENNSKIGKDIQTENESTNKEE